MTQARSLSKENLVTGRYIKYRLKRSWAVMLLAFIVMFFCLVVPFLMQADYLRSGYDNDLDPENRIDRLTNFFYGNITASLIFSAILALFAGCSALKYLHSKVSAGFFHAIPERRSGHYIASLTVAFADFLIPFILNLLILLLAVATNGMLYDFVFVLILKLALLSVLAYAVALAPCFLAGMLTGTSVIHAIFTLYLIFVLPVIYISVCYWTRDSLNYMSYDIWTNLSYDSIILTPIARVWWIALLLLEETTDKIPAIVSLVLELILTPVCYIGAYHVYKKRPIEATGTPIINKRLSAAVKYSVMLPSTFIFAILFDALGGDGWGIFGFIVGALLTFMLMNCILNRTTKAMFTGLRGLAVFAVVAVAVFTVAATGVFGVLDHAVPHARTVTVTIDGIEYELTDGELIGEFRKEMKHFNKKLKNDKDSVIYDNVDYIVRLPEDAENYYGEIEEKYPYGDDVTEALRDNVRTARFGVRYTVATGKVMRFTYSNVYMTELTELKRICQRASEQSENEFLFDPDISIKSTDVYLSFYVDSSLLKEIVSDADLDLSGIYDVSLLEKTDYFIVEAGCALADELPKEASEIYSEFLYEMKQSASSEEPRQSIGNVSVYGYNGHGQYRQSSVPLFPEDLSLFESVMGSYGILEERYINIRTSSGEHCFGDDVLYNSRVLSEIFKQADGYTADFADGVSYLYLYDAEEDKTEKITDADRIGELMSHAAQISHCATVSPFTPTDNKYVLYVQMKDGSTYITYLLEE